MNRCSIFTACFALLALVTPSAANAEVSLAADLIAGAESSSATPVGRVSQGLLLLAKTASGSTDLMLAREPSGSIERITTLTTNSQTTTSASTGLFFTIPAGLAGAGTNWFTDGTAAGTISVPFSKGSVFQQSGADVVYMNPNEYSLGRYNLATGAHEPGFINAGAIPVRAIVQGVPLGISYGYVYQWNVQIKGWESIGSVGSNFALYVYTGKNRDVLYTAGAEQFSENLYVHYVYRVEPNYVRTVSMLSVDERSLPIYLTTRGEGSQYYWAFVMTSEYGTEEYYNIAPVVEAVAPYDGGLGYVSVGRNYTNIPSTLLGSRGFAARSGRLHSLASYYSEEIPHENLTWQQEDITVSALRIVGDTLLIFGSTPSRGAEVWSTPVDSCPNDSAKLYAGTCGCGIADTDSDRDGTPDCIDVCASDSTKIAGGVCGCGVPDVDPDGDGTMSCIDLCPLDGTKTAPGACGCGNADTDSDGDGTPNCQDSCSSDAKKTTPGACGCGIVEVDSDKDGTMDCQDQCSTSALKTTPGVCGCNVADTDTDNDGYPDCIDTCKLDRSKLGAGSCGCGVAETDSDGDFAPDCVDQCPSDKFKTLPGIAGCGLSDLDTDGDKTPDVQDQCPKDFTKTTPGACGCSASERDDDHDGIADCVDECSSDPYKSKAGVCGCGVFDTDSDNDGTVDCLDLCPNEKSLTQPINGSCQRAAASVDLCYNDPAKLSPGVCGCGVADIDANQNGIVDCKESMAVTVAAPAVGSRTIGKAARLLVSMTTVPAGTYYVEATRLDKKGSKPVTKTVRAATATVSGIATKSRWSVRYRVVTGGVSSEWSSAVRVRVK